MFTHHYKLQLATFAFLTGLLLLLRDTAVHATVLSVASKDQQSQLGFA